MKVTIHKLIFRLYITKIYVRQKWYTMLMQEVLGLKYILLTNKIIGKFMNTNIGKVIIWGKCYFLFLMK
ncbi:protein of unknown function [Clostridium beijerinckii]|nr:protein of unknown function [Clostridium beijerinckii]